MRGTSSGTIDCIVSESRVEHVTPASASDELEFRGEQDPVKASLGCFPVFPCATPERREEYLPLRLSSSGAPRRRAARRAGLPDQSRRLGDSWLAGC